MICLTGEIISAAAADDDADSVFTALYE